MTEAPERDEPKAEGSTVGQAAAQAKPKRRLRIILALVCLCIVAPAVLLLGAEYYTARPEFCGSCHIMRDYYESWEKSAHSDIACVECHYAPGEQHTVKAKLKGLSQLVSYVAGRQGTRPRAEVGDASCLQSACHSVDEAQGDMLTFDKETGKLRVLHEELKFHGIKFSHKNHLNDRQPEGVKEKRKILCVGCHAQIVEHDRTASADAAGKAATKAKMQGQDGEEEDEDWHMRVSKATCFLCHFKSVPFNTKTGECLMCHELPEKPIQTHGEKPTTHKDLQEKKVACKSCHYDAVRGEGTVHVERCYVCHNRPDDLKKFEDRELMHLEHVTKRKVECIDCHLTIEHGTPKEFNPVAVGCTYCHPDHHENQRRLLVGIGGHGVKPTPGPMFGSRTNCLGCHVKPAKDMKGDALIKATKQSCVPCHSKDHEKLFDDWTGQLKRDTQETLDIVGEVQDALKEAKKGPKRDKAQKLFDEAQQNIQFVKAGNGIHNKKFAIMLLDAAADRLEEALDLLEAED